jgi:glutamate-1-semialdehyde 2,1-aminomutase
MRESVQPYARSEALHAEASRYLAGGVSSNFRLSPFSVPLFFERAAGAYLYDVDGNAYVDYALGMGPVLLGHAPPEVLAAVERTLADGQLFAGQHSLEVELARLLCALVPSAERVRFGLSGSEMVQLALRVARAATGRPRVLKFEGHYHGWFDNVYVGVAPPGLGELGAGQSALAGSEVSVLPWNDLDEVERFLTRRGSETAAVVMEPILCNTGVCLPRPGYLEGVRALCDEHGALLVFDEVITGFRVGPGGAQGLLGVTPDLTVLAKALGAGFAIGALAGRADLLDPVGDGRVLHGGTYNTNVVSTAAAHAVLELLARDGERLYAGIAAEGGRLLDGLGALGLHVQGLPGVFNTAFLDGGEIADARDYARADLGRQRAFLRALQDRGVRVTSRGTWFLSTAHGSDEIDRTLDAAADALVSL